MHTFPEDGTGESDSFIGNVETSEGVELKLGTGNKTGNEPGENTENRGIGDKTDRTREFTYKSDLWTVLPGIGLLFLAVFVSQTIYFPRNLPKCDNPVETNEFHKDTENLLENSLDNSLKNSLKTLTNSFENEKIAQNKQKSIQTQESDSTRTIRHTPYNPDLIKTRFENRLSYYKTQCEAYLEADHKGTTKSVIDNGIDGHTSWMIYSRKNDLQGGFVEMSDSGGMLNFGVKRSFQVILGSFGVIWVIWGSFGVIFRSFSSFLGLSE